MNNIALLTTGDEIVNGDILNTNSYNIAHHLHQHGLSPGMHISCTDDENQLIDAMRYLLNHHQTMIITGGLGPTSDDRTRFALSKVINTPLRLFEESWQEIQARFKRMGLELKGNNKQQCYFPENASLIANHYGTAMGCKVIFDDKLIYMLPGPPRECLPMFENHVLDELKQTFGKNHPMLKWRIFGLAEGQISSELDEALAEIDCQTGYRWDYPYIEFKVLSAPQHHEQIIKIIEPKLAPHIISPADKSASTVLQELLMTVRPDVLIQDFATGGALEATIAKPELASTLHFHNPCNYHHKIKIKGLEDYWLQQKLGTTTIELEFERDNEHFTESHTLPYRNQFIIKYAVELIASRITEFLR